MENNNIIITLRYNVNLDRGVVRQRLPVEFGTGDKEAHKIILTACRATGVVDLTGAGVMAYVNRNDGTSVIVDGTVEDGKAVVILPEACYVVNGAVSIVVKLTTNETRATALWLDGHINRTSNGELVDPGGVVPSLEELLAEIDNMRDATESANEAAISVNAFKTEISDDIAAFSEEISDVKIDVADITEVSPTPKVVHITMDWTSGQIKPDGEIYNGAEDFSLQYSQRIPVEESDVIYFPSIASIGQSSIRYLAMYKDGAISDAETPASLDGRITIPANVDEIVVTVYKSRGYTYLVKESAQLAPKGFSALAERITAIETKRPYYMAIKADTMNRVSMKMNTLTNCRKNEVLTFSGKLTDDFNYLEVGFSKQKNTLDKINRVKIDANELTIYGLLSSPTVVAHGLTLSNNLQVKWEQNEKANGVVVSVVSNGKEFRTQEIYYGKNAIATPYAICDGVMTDCTLSYTCKDLRKPLWILGDSYTSWDSNGVRWLYYAHRDGIINNFYLDGLSGGGSAGAYAAFADMVDNFATPRYALWILGMNDGSDSDAAPSASWVTYRDMFIAKCEENGIEPIFGTVPTVPNINHERKNAWIRTSGYRYVDFAKAVGASASGVWYGDMLGADNVHPTADGARALYYCMLNDLPEIVVH